MIDVIDDAIDIEVLSEAAPIDAELDYKGEIIRADADALKKEYDNGYNDGYVLGDHEGFERGYGEGHTDGFDLGALPMYYIKSLNAMFMGTIFAENTELIVKMLQCNTLNYAFTNTQNIKKLVLTIETPATIPWSMVFSSMKGVEYIDLSKCRVKPTDFTSAFSSNQTLKSIKGNLDLSECTKTTSAFFNDTALEEVSFVPQSIKLSIDFYWCAYLTPATVDSIIEGLADLTGGTAQKVTFHSDIMDNLTPAQMNAMTAKNWLFE